MQQLIIRLRGEHLAMESDLSALQLRVARRPVSRLALMDLLNLLDTRLLPHERLEETRLFPNLGSIPPEPAIDDHERFSANRARLREGLAGWTKRRKPGDADLDDLACMAEDLILGIIQHFKLEDEQVFQPFGQPEGVPGKLVAQAQEEKAAVRAGA